MGNEESTMVDESVAPETLKARNVEALADYIKSGKAKQIVVMTGAGISTSAGIPDFRSPDTGLYANLQRLDLPYAEAVFDISYFRTNPLPFYTLAHELYPGKYRPTIAHSFIALLHQKGLLSKLFTQNIDCLERAAGVPDDRIIEAHGSFARQRCIECGTASPDEQMLAAVRDKTVPRCLDPACAGLVKPDIVFFGEALPEAFFRNRHLPGIADLCIIMGTSLSVQPFASLPQFAGDGVPRALINKERVGDIGSRADDVLLLGECDDGVRRLAEALGWRDELEALWKTTKAEGTTELRHAGAPQDGSPTGAKQTIEELTVASPRIEDPEDAPPVKIKTKDELLDDEITKLTADVEASLKMSNDHAAWVRKGLGEGGAKEQTERAAAAGDPAALAKPHETPGREAAVGLSEGVQGVKGEDQAKGEGEKSEKNASL